MNYFGQQSDILHTAKRGILLLNLGTPDKAICPALRRYLSEFLMDPRVIELPYLLRLILVRGIIVNTRSHKSAAVYREVWTEEGSPLLTYTKKLTEKVRKQSNDDTVVDFAMRYGKPNVKSVLQKMHNAGVRELTVIPLYPQYSATSTGSAFDSIAKNLTSFRWVPKLNFINEYYQHPDYIQGLANSIQASWDEHGRNELLVMSFHGVPEKYINNGDPYQHQCETTAKLVAEKLSLDDTQWKVVYQSRLGRQKWIDPYCDITLSELPKSGTKSVDLVCPGFSVDCLETLEEIAMENKQIFLDAGGEKYNYIPCLNDSDAHAKLLLDIAHNETIS